MGSNTAQSSRSAIWLDRLALLPSVWFITLGALFIPLAGIQNDEALFMAPLYVNVKTGFWTALRHLQIPAMVMSYLGTLKMYVYMPLLAVTSANVWTVRLPMVIAGGVTIWLFYRVTASVLGRPAALGAAFLLATDPVFLLTDTFDWGPVALEHLLLLSACLLLYKFATKADPQTHAGRTLYLAAGFFCLGLGLWNKAIFSWALAGLCGATVLVFWHTLRRLLSLRNVAVAGIAFGLGALPLLAYNVRHKLETFRQNTHLDASIVPSKWIQAKSAANGNSLFGYLVLEEEAPNSKRPAGIFGETSLWIRQHAGQRRQTGFYYVLGALFLLGSPWWWRSRTAWFSLVFCTISWLLMALTVDAGGTAHHVILLWPFPILFAVAVLASLPWSKLRLPNWSHLIIVIPMVAMNLLVLNQYFSQFQRFGAGDTFSDAIFPLSNELPEGNGDTIYITDWGMFDSFNLLHKGKLTLRIASGFLTEDQPSPDDQRQLEVTLADPTAIFVSHLKEHESFANVGEHLNDRLVEAGYHKTNVQTVADSNGRPIFEVFRVVR